MASKSGWGAWRIGRTGMIEFAALTGLGLFMAAIGPFGTEERGLAERTFYWLILIVGGGVIAALIEPVLVCIRALAAAPRMFAVVQTLVMTPPITMLVWLVSWRMFDGALSAAWYVSLLPRVLVVNVVVVSLAWLIRRTLVQPPSEAPAMSPPPAIAEKLPPKLARADLLAVEAEDHYLRVHTSAGAALILMRFSDALEALKGSATPGLRTHRSWWVGADAVELCAFRDGRGELTLKGGIKAPVSRSYAESVRQTRWV